MAYLIDFGRKVLSVREKENLIYALFGYNCASGEEFLRWYC